MASAVLRSAPLVQVPPPARRRPSRSEVCLHPRALFELWGPAVEAAATRTARRFRLTDDQAEDLRSELWVKVSARQGRLLRHFRGQASIETYLTSVAHNLLLDQRIRDWGRWRPSVVARQHGPLGIELDRLIRRDGFTMSEAEQWFLAAYPETDRSWLRELCQRLKARSRRTFVAAECVDHYQSDPAVDLQAEAEAARERRRALAALRRALDGLAPADRQLLIHRYCHGISLATLAEQTAQAAKPLYRHCEQLLRDLRRAIERDGVTRAAVTGWIGMPLEAEASR